MGGDLRVDDKGFPGAQLLQSLGHEHADVGGVHPYQPIHRPCRVQQGAQHVQCSSHLHHKDSSISSEQALTYSMISLSKERL